MLSLNLINMVYEQYWAVRRRLPVIFNQAIHWRKVSKTLKLSPKARQRLEWIIYYRFTAQNNASKTCRHFAISRKVFYVWLHRFDERNLRTLEDLPKAPKRTRQREITSLEEDRIVSLRKAHIRWGKMKLQRLYLNTHGEPISSWKIQYTIQKYQLYYHPLKNERMQQRRQRNQAKKRITELKKQPFAGYLIALDCLVIYNTLNDNGSEFHKEFIEACRELGISQYWSRIHTPTDNPIDERFNRTLKEEFIELGNFNPDPVQFNKGLTEWLVEYVFVRPHQALGYDTPWQFYQKINKVLPMCPSRTFA